MTSLPSSVPQAPVTILDVYVKQIELAASLGQIHEQLKAIPDHEGRIRRLEETRARLIGASVGVSALVSGAATWLGIILTRGR